MFQDENLKNHLETSFSISSRSAVIAEWNMNVPGNFFKAGNYRYRPDQNLFGQLPNFFDRLDIGGFYKNATDSDTTVQSGVKEDGVTPLLFTYNNEKEKLYYSIEDCLKPFRPRSGINKLSFFTNKYLSNPNIDMYRRPRYYMPHRDDEFKYWRSYRTESNNKIILDNIVSAYSIPTPTIENSNLEYGISKNSSTGIYKIEDAVPFVVYKEDVPANRIVLKVQTNIGDINLGPFKSSAGANIDDPFFGNTNKTVPQRFKVQYLSPDSLWLDAYEFDETSLRDDNESPIFSSDGYLSLEYGLEIPLKYKDNFFFVGTTSSEDALPDTNIKGYAYLLKTSETDIGTIYVWNGIDDYDTFIPVYKWKIGTDGIYETSQFVTDLVNPSFYKNLNDDVPVYREFVWIKGIRIVVESMNTPNTPFELIEMSPRLVVDLTGKMVNYEVSKTLSDLSSSALPVGQIMSSSGSIKIFDDEQAFNINNVWDGSSGSIVAKYVQKNIKFVFYEVIENVDVTDISGNTNNVNYYVPIKHLYSEGIPQTDQSAGVITINLKDFYFYLESITAPQILLTEVSLSQAVCILLDSIGFSNYVFKRLDEEKDPVVPYFFIAPDQNVAEVLYQLAVATQSAMFFDEYNNFVVMTKEYLLDNTGARSLDMTLYGSQNPTKIGINENVTPTPLPNIISVASQDQKVYNAGSINYTTRYIQRSYANLQQSLYTDKTWVYKPALLWEVSGTESTKSANAETQQKFVLGAMPLNTDLSELVPTVQSRQLINNVFDVGENAYWITRFKGFLYSNAEIIKYDAVEYSVTGTGNVWISSNQEYQKYFSELPFNGKMYPTGLIRIYAEPYFEEIDGILKLKNGPVVSHGRGQFGTNVTYHSAGLNPYWTNNANVQGCQMNSQYLFTTEPNPILPSTTIAAAGVNQSKAQKSQRTGIIKNFLSSGYSSETNVSFLQTNTSATIQSSALVFNGPDFDVTEKPRDFISYVYKPLNGAYKHFGTRMRIIGKVEALGDRAQSPVGGMTYFNVPGTDPTQTVSIGGGSGGLALVDPSTNIGYYFEISALTTSSIESYLNRGNNNESSIVIDNIMFYQIKKDSTSTNATPIKLWGGNSNIIVNDGNLTGQYRFFSEENPSVYDLAIEYVDLSPTTRVWYLYINQQLIKTVTDNNPLPLQSSSLGLFVRGTSKAMFENFYMLSQNYSQNTVFSTGVPIASIFGDGDSQINASEALDKYALSGVMQKTFLKGVSPISPPSYQLDFEEFGTIMRECAYFNIKYDRAYPALYATLAPTLNRLKGYSVSGFVADSYGAEFLIFNNTDRALNLDETTGNYLRIIGVTFTQDTTQTITVDDYLNRRGNLSDPELKGDTVIRSPFVIQEQYDKIKQSRILYGKNEFVLESPYIQDSDTAENLIGWIISKNLEPRKAVGINVFPNPMIQLGDIVNINYKNNEGIDVVSSADTRFIVYNISYSKSIDGPAMTLYLSEV